MVIDAFKIIYNYKIGGLGVLKKKGKEKDTDDSANEGDIEEEASPEPLHDVDNQEPGEDSERSDKDEGEQEEQSDEGEVTESEKESTSVEELGENPEVLEPSDGLNVERSNTSQDTSVRCTKNTGTLLAHISASDLKNFEPSAMIRCLHMSIEEYLSCFKDKMPLVCCHVEDTTAHILRLMENHAVTHLWIVERYDLQGCSEKTPDFGPPLGLLSLRDIIDEMMAC